jgi:hypothetical protein
VEVKCSDGFTGAQTTLVADFNATGTMLLWTARVDVRANSSVLLATIAISKIRDVRLTLCVQNILTCIFL